MFSSFNVWHHIAVELRFGAHLFSTYAVFIRTTPTWISATARNNNQECQCLTSMIISGFLFFSENWKGVLTSIISRKWLH